MQIWPKCKRWKKYLVSFILCRDVFREYRLHLRFAKSPGLYKYCWMIWNVKNLKISHLSLHGHRLSVFLKSFWSILPKASLCSSGEQPWAVNLVGLRQSADKVACRHVCWEVGRKPFNLETCLGLFLKQNKQLLFRCTWDTGVKELWLPSWPLLLSSPWEGFLGLILHSET